MSYLAITTPGLPATIQAALQFSTRSSYGSDGQFDGSVIDGAKVIGDHDEATLRAANRRRAPSALCSTAAARSPWLELSKLRAKNCFSAAQTAATLT